MWVRGTWEITSSYQFFYERKTALKNTVFEKMKNKTFAQLLLRIIQTFFLFLFLLISENKQVNYMLN